MIEPHLEGVEFMILDNLSALCREGVESEGESWVPIQSWLLQLRRRGISSEFIHHAGKNKTQRGTSRREDLLDTVIALRRPTDYSPEEGLRCEVHFEKKRGMLGSDAMPFEIKLESGLSGQAIWTMRDLENAKFDQAAKLFADKMSVRDVAKEMGVSVSAAGRYRKRWDTNSQKVEIERDRHRIRERVKS
jgi:putative DNA primase/helicase